MKRVISSILTLILFCSFMPCAFAANDEAINAANALYELGLFQGTGTDENGNPNFDLDRVPTRNEAVTMLVRLLGKGEEAESKEWDIPFTDVDAWAKPYVGYAYSAGLTSGTSGTTFGGTNPVSATQYITFILRALGYENGKDFQWDKAYELSDKLGLSNGQYKDSAQFTRGDVATLSYKTLGQKSKNANVSLIQNLASCSAVKEGATLSNLLKTYGGIDYYPEYSVLPKVENVNLTATLKKRQPLSGALYFVLEYPFDSEYEASSTCNLYRSFLQSQGFTIRNTGNSYMTEYTVSVPTTGKSFDIYIHRIAEGEPWCLNISIPIDDVSINNNSYDTYFSLSASELTVNRLGTTTLTATIQSTDPSIRVEWNSFDEKVVMIGKQTTIVRDGHTEVSVQIGGVQSGKTFVDATLYVNNENYDMAMCWVEVPVDIQKSPVKITNISSEMNSVGGTTFTFDVTNNGTKTIKYVSVYWRCLNAVGDYLHDTISLDDRFSGRITGPIAPGETLTNMSNTRPFYNYNFANKIEMIEIVITYMDDSVEVVNPTNYTDYWDLD